MRLAGTFVTGLAARSSGELGELDKLDELLVAIISAARRAWPALEVPDDAYVRYLAERLPAAWPVLDVQQLHTTDLYLACACVRGLSEARAAFEHLFAQIRAAVGAVATSNLDDVEQILRERLLLDDPPELADYAGTGELVAWLRVVAIRTALGLRRGHAKEIAVGDAALGALTSASLVADPHLQHVKGTYHAEFRDAVRESLHALDPRDRSLLRYRYLDGASIDEVAKIYAINRATAARWIGKAEERLREATRRLLMHRLRIERSEFESVMRLLQSQLDASLHDLLDDPG